MFIDECLKNQEPVNQKVMTKVIIEFATAVCNELDHQQQAATINQLRDMVVNKRNDELDLLRKQHLEIAELMEKKRCELGEFKKITSQ